MDNRLSLITGIDIPIPECQLIMHQPTLKEISFIGERNFFMGMQTLCIYKEMFSVSEDKNVLDSMTNFQVFMMIMTDKRTEDKKQPVIDLLSLVFPEYKVLFTPNSLLFQKEGSLITIDESNFDYLQEGIREIFGSKKTPMDQQNFNPGNAKAKEIAEKLMRGRQRVAAQKGNTNTCIFGMYISVLAIALKMSMTEISNNYTVFMLYDQIERYSLYMGWDIDLRVRLAGGKPDSTPDNWMKNIH